MKRTREAPRLLDSWCGDMISYDLPKDSDGVGSDVETTKRREMTLAATVVCSTVTVNLLEMGGRPCWQGLARFFVQADGLSALPFLADQIRSSVK
jgi:hypothetical protein